MILLNTETRSHRVFRYQKKINLRVFVPLCSELDKSKLFLKKHFFIFTSDHILRPFYKN